MLCDQQIIRLGLTYARQLCDQQIIIPTYARLLLCDQQIMKLGVSYPRKSVNIQKMIFIIFCAKVSNWYSFAIPMIPMLTHKICFGAKRKKKYPNSSNNPKYWDRQAWANSVDTDQGWHYLSLILQFFRTHQQVIKWISSNFRTIMVGS